MNTGDWDVKGTRFEKLRFNIAFSQGIVTKKSHKNHIAVLPPLDYGPVLNLDWALKMNPRLGVGGLFKLENNLFKFF